MDNIEKLQKEIEQLQIEIKNLKESRNHWAGMCRHFTIRSTRFEEALEYYADEKNYEYEYGIDGLPYRDKGIPIQKDKGKIARDILEDK